MLINRNLSKLKSIWSYLPSSNQYRILGAIFLSVFSSLFELINVFLAGIFAFVISGNRLEDLNSFSALVSKFNLSSSSLSDQIKFIGIFFVINLLLLALLNLINLRYKTLTVANIITHFTNKLINSAFQTNFRFFTSLKQEELINALLVESGQATNFLFGPTLELINAIIILSIFIGFWLFTNFKGTLYVIIIVFTLFYLLNSIFFKILERLGVLQVKIGDSLTQSVLLLSNMYREYILQGNLDNRISNVKKYNKNYRYNFSHISSTKNSSSIIAQPLMFGAFVLFLAFSLSDQGMQSSQFSAVTSLLYTVQRITPQFQRILRSSTSLNVGFPAFEKLLNKIDLYSSNKNKILFDNSTSNSDEILIKSINYIEVIDLKLPTIIDSNIQKTVSFTLSPYQALGIKGPSGTGKTTILEILSGIYSVNSDSGKVLINDVDINSFNYPTMKKWMKSIAYVSQSPYLIPGTLKENITHLSSETFDLSRYNNLLNLPWMKDVLYSLNIDTSKEQEIDPSGTNLSGGQIQRIAIARALYTKSSLLLLDESTSALDRTNEDLLVDTLIKEKNNRSIIFVSHRDNPLKICDEIINFNRLL